MSTCGRGYVDYTFPGGTKLMVRQSEFDSYSGFPTKSSSSWKLWSKQILDLILLTINFQESHSEHMLLFYGYSLEETRQKI